jgi:DNA uptake protein ComE-like DNA-binding protein
MLKKLISGLLALVILLTGACALAADPDPAAKFKDGKLNLNLAAVEDLVKVPGIDKALAEKILDARKKTTEFVDLEELKDIPGIDDALFRKLKNHVFVEPAAGCNC